MTPSEYLFKIVEGLDTQYAEDGHSDCRRCLTSRDRDYQATWTIRLLARCSGGCGCVVQLDHISAVHDSTGVGDWEGTYSHPAEIGDPALRRYAEALLAGRPRPPYPPALPHSLIPPSITESKDQP
ncbi:hypothetical protein [Nonomuraea aridisoli]|uniref:Uncharacterized protein n=1 Tax=Nonomuraea aridisoli TaxID=2070368 RepID=A0A2W2FYN8_9ACTN|nr:hypothetical protein [Nonomuraea aridisoli]PZG19924.1 hypothetical protein C1J01_10815 [Nonomuraea aridisoli]